MRGGGVGAHLPQKVISKEYTVNNENNTADNNKIYLLINASEYSDACELDPRQLFKLSAISEATMNF